MKTDGYESRKGGGATTTTRQVDEIEEAPQDNFCWYLPQRRYLLVFSITVCGRKNKYF